MLPHSAWRPGKYGDRIGNVSAYTVKKIYGKFGELMNGHLSSFVRILYSVQYTIYAHIFSYNTL